MGDGPCLQSFLFQKYTHTLQQSVFTLSVTASAGELDQDSLWNSSLLTANKIRSSYKGLLSLICYWILYQMLHNNTKLCLFMLRHASGKHIIHTNILYTWLRRTYRCVFAATCSTKWMVMVVLSTAYMRHESNSSPHVGRLWFLWPLFLWQHGNQFKVDYAV